MDYVEVIKHCEKRRDQAGVNPLLSEEYEKAILMMAYLLNDKEAEIDALYRDMSGQSI